MLAVAASLMAIAACTSTSCRPAAPPPQPAAPHVSGFTFAPIASNELAALQERGIALAASDRRGFRVDVGETWRTASPAQANAKRFFVLLLARVRARPDVFRGIIGPPDPAHTTHLHLDAGPWAFSRYAPPS